MKRTVQRLLLFVYRTVAATGVLSTRPGRWLFNSAYSLYKRYTEAGNIELMRPLIRPGTSIIDAGANIGEFTLAFARWVTDGGRVYAFEPEPTNFRNLVERLDRAGLSERVAAVQAAVADLDGELHLIINQAHPGDHRLGEAGMAVKVSTIDSFLERHGWPEISLIKIDVQGAERKILAGARRTLESQRPALHLEVDDESLRNFDTNARELLEGVISHGYTIHRLLSQEISEPIDLEEALEQQAAEGYIDVLCVARHST